MRKFNYLSFAAIGTIFLGLFLSIAIFNACRKTEQAVAPKENTEIVPGENSGVSQKFFSAHNSSDSIVKAVQNFVLHQNDKYHFIDDLVNRIGFPYWDKALIFSNKHSGNNYRSSSTDSFNVVYIPFVKDTQNFVNASLILKMTETDTAFRLLSDWQYSQFGFSDTDTGWNARDIFHIFAKLDNTVFGTEKFRLVDENLLSVADHAALNNLGLPFDSVKIIYTFGDHLNNGRLAYLIQTEVCDPFSVCIDHSCPPLGFRQNQDFKTQSQGECCAMFLTGEVCTTVWVDVGGSGGGSGGGTGDPGSGGGGTWTPPPQCSGNPGARSSQVVDPCQPGWDGGSNQYPYVSSYQMTQHEIDVFNQIDAEDNAADQQAQNLNCKGTKMSGGNISFNGTKEHWLIQLDYIAKNPLGGEREFAIPNSGASGGRGYADIANIVNGNIFEIKPNNQAGIDAGITEVTNYVSKASAFCSSTLPPGIFWNKGTAYSTTYIPSGIPGHYLKASKIADGVIGYEYELPGNPVPLPVTIPTTILDKLKYLIQRLKDNLANANKIIAEFFNQNPELLTFIKSAAIGAGIAIIVGTILEDIFTGGWGIADDWASFMLAKRIIRFALEL